MTADFPTIQGQAIDCVRESVEKAAFGGNNVRIAHGRVVFVVVYGLLVGVRPVFRPGLGGCCLLRRWRAGAPATLEDIAYNLGRIRQKVALGFSTHGRRPAR